MRTDPVVIGSFVHPPREPAAAAELAQTRAPVTQICLASGFSSMNRLYAAYYDAFSSTPAAYRIRPG